MFHILYKKVNHFYESVFEVYGKFLAKHYVLVIVAALIVNVILSAGSFNLTMVTDADELFIPQNGVAKRDEFHIKELFAPVIFYFFYSLFFKFVNLVLILKDKLDSNDFFLHQLADFGSWTEVNFLTCNKDGQYDNILQPYYLKKIAHIHKQLVENTVVKVNNKTINFESICARQQGRCLIDGLDLTEPLFYETQLAKFSRRKDTLDRETKKLNVFKSKSNKKNEFRFFINGMSLTDLTYNLGKIISFK